MSVEQYVENYENEYKRLNRQRKLFLIIWIVCMFACLVVVIAARVNVWGLLVVIYGAAIIVLFSFELKTQKNISVIYEKCMDDLDMKFAEAVFRKLLEKDRRRDYGDLMMYYLPILLSTQQHEEFCRNYNLYSTKCSRKNVAFLKLLRERILGLSRDRTAYEKMIFAHKFSKYHNVEGELKGYKARLRNQDREREIEQLYLNKEYEKMIEKLKNTMSGSRLEQLATELRIQKCLYHMGRKDEIIVPDAPEELTRAFRHLLETGEGIYLENAEEILAKIDTDIKKVDRKQKIARIVVIVGLIILYFSMADLATEEVAKGYGVSAFRYNLETHDFQYTTILDLVLENDDLIAGVVYGKPAEADKEQLYLVGFDYKRHNFQDTVEMQIQLIGDAVEDEHYYTFTGDESTYVMYIRESTYVVNYDGEWLLDKNDMWSTGGEEQWLSAFLVDGTFDPDKLDVEDEIIEEIENVKEEYEIGEYVYDGSDFTMYYFLNENIGWELRVIDSASGNRWYQLVQTEDGGETWDVINQDPYDGIGGTADGLKFYDENYGYISIACFSSTVSHIYMTEDGGESFWEMVMPTGECTDVENILDYQYAQMPEEDGDNVRIVVKRYRLDSEPGLVFESGDRGRNWTYVGREE